MWGHLFHEIDVRKLTLSRTRVHGRFYEFWVWLESIGNHKYIDFWLISGYFLDQKMIIFASLFRNSDFMKNSFSPIRNHHFQWSEASEIVQKSIRKRYRTSNRLTQFWQQRLKAKIKDFEWKVGFRLHKTSNQSHAKTCSWTLWSSILEGLFRSKSIKKKCKFW